MKITTFLISAISLLFSVSATAAPLPVLSGEHGGFTRVVVQLPAVDAAWSINRASNQVTLTFPSHKSGFETASIFDLIPRDRVSGVTSSGNSLTLELACNCQVAAFLERNVFVVIDVAKEGVDLAGVTVRRSDSEQATSSAEIGSARPVRLSLSARAPLAASSSPRFLLPVTEEPASLSAAEQKVLAEMQQQLARQLGAAASRGVLVPAPGRKPAMQLPVERVQARGDFHQMANPPEREGPLSNIKISSSRDLPQKDHPHGGVVTVAGAACPEQDAFDVSTWGDETPFEQQISAARAGLFGELDRLDHEVATRLAKQYLYFGFGAEARQVLELDSTLANAHRPLLLIADFLDGQPLRENIAFEHYVTCHPEVALWATLAETEPLAGASPDTNSALRALNKLPPHLRQILAPKLSSKMLAYGEEQSATMALRSLQRLPDHLPSAAKLARAEIELHSGNITDGTATLVDVADDYNDQSPAALIALVDARIAANQPIEIDATNLIAAYAHELRETEMGPDLRRAHVLALLKSGQFDEAFELSLAQGGNERSDTAQELQAQLLRELTTNADDIVFLDHVFAQPESHIARLPGRDQAALANRFLSLGFAERAERTLSYVPDRNMTVEQRILAARISLALNKPYKAQASLLGVTHETAQLLRADAKRMVGAHDEAHKLYMQTAQSEAAAETGWLSDEWQDLTTAQTPVFGAASQLAQEDVLVTTSPAGMLARTAAALDESAEARQTLTELLNADALRVRAN